MHREASAGAARASRIGQRHALSLVVLGVVLYSIGPVFVAASSVSGPIFSFWRLWCGVGVLGLATGIHALLTDGGRSEGRGWAVAAAAGAAFGIHQLFLFTAVKAASVADVTLINALAPIATAVLAVRMFGERPGRGFRGWSLVAMAGSAVIVLGASGTSGQLIGMVLALANVIFFAVFFVLSKRSRDHMAVLPFLLVVMTVAALVVSGYVLAAGEAPGSANGTDLLYAFVVAAGPGAVGHFVMTWPLRWIAANVPPVMRLGTPILAAVWALIFLGEPITTWHLGGGAVTITGVAGALLSPSGRRFVASEQPPGAHPDPSG